MNFRMNGGTIIEFGRNTDLPVETIWQVKGVKGPYYFSMTFLGDT
ncbi:hypothetical protein AAKU67_001128 [Oxalobacteraceae bacterium GrIS 2.11]